MGNHKGRMISVGASTVDHVVSDHLSVCVCVCVVPFAQPSRRDLDLSSLGGSVPEYEKSILRIFVIYLINLLARIFPHPVCLSSEEDCDVVSSLYTTSLRPFTLGLYVWIRFPVMNFSTFLLAFVPSGHCCERHLAYSLLKPRFHVKPRFQFPI